MRKSIIAASILLLALSIWSLKLTTIDAPEIEKPGTLTPEPSVTPQPERPTASPAASAVSNEPAPAPLVSKLPRLEEYRKQAGTNPHAPPPAGAAFAIELAERVEKAIVSEKASFALLKELDACASNQEPGTIVPSIQSLCLRAARELSKAHPNLTKDVEDVFDRAEPETAALGRALED